MKPVVKIAMASLKSVPGQVILNLSKGSLTLQTEIIKSGKFLGRYCFFCSFQHYIPFYSASIVQLRHKFKIFSVHIFWQRYLQIRGQGRLQVRDLTWSFFACSQNIDFPESFILPLFARKVSIVIFRERGYALSPSQNDKTFNIW